MDEDDIEIWYAEETNKKFEVYKELIKLKGQKAAFEWYQMELAQIREKYLSLYEGHLSGKKKRKVALLERITAIQEKVRGDFNARIKAAAEFAKHLNEKDPRAVVVDAERQSRRELKNLKLYIAYRNFLAKYKLDYPLILLKYKVNLFFAGIGQFFTVLKKSFLELIEKVIFKSKELFLRIIGKYKLLFGKLMAVVTFFKNMYTKRFDFIKGRIYKFKGLFKRKQENAPQQPHAQPATTAQGTQQVLSAGVVAPVQPVTPTAAMAPVNEKKGGELKMERERKMGLLSSLLNLFKSKKPEQANPMASDPKPRAGSQSAKPQSAAPQQIQAPPSAGAQQVQPAVFPLSPVQPEMPGAEEKKEAAKKPKKAPAKRRAAKKK